MSVILFLLKEMIYSLTYTKKAAGRTSFNLLTELMSKIIFMQRGMIKRSLEDLINKINFLSYGAIVAGPKPLPNC